MAGQVAALKSDKDSQLSGPDALSIDADEFFRYSHVSS
jgi:hypothetical protein